MLEKLPLHSINQSLKVVEEKTNISFNERGFIEFRKFYAPMLKIFIPAYIYAFFRYTVNHNEPWYDMPFYLFNKVLGVTAVVLIGLAYIIGPLAKVIPRYKQYLGHRKYFGIGGFLLSSAHGIMSLLLMTPSNYKIFYNLETGRLNINGSLSMLFGTLALLHFGFLSVISIPAVMKGMHGKQWKSLQRGGLFALGMAFLHVTFFGYKSWFNLEKWYGGMPPFSMIGASAIVILVLGRVAVISLGRSRLTKRIEVSSQ